MGNVRNKATDASLILVLFHPSPMNMHYDTAYSCAIVLCLFIKQLTYSECKAVR